MNSCHQIKQTSIMNLCQISNNKNSTNAHYTVHHSNLPSSMSPISNKTLINANIKNGTHSESNVIVDPLMSNGSSKKFILNSSFNQSNRNKFAYRNYLSKTTSNNNSNQTRNEFSFSRPDLFIKEEEIIEKKEKDSIEIFSSLSSSSSSSSSTSSSISPTFSGSICYDNSNYTEVDNTLNHNNFNQKVKSNESNLNKSKEVLLSSPQIQLRNDMSNFEDLQKAGMILRKALREIKSLKILQEPTNNFNSMNTCNSSCINKNCINEISTKTNKQNFSSNCSSLSDLAFDNLTYLSSNENLKESNLITTTTTTNNSINKNQSNQTQINSDIIKKTLKSIKRKEKMKKSYFLTNEHENLDKTNDNVSYNNNNNNRRTSGKSILLSQAKSMPDLSMTCKEDTKSKATSSEIGLSNTDISNFEYEKQLRKMYRNKSLSRSLRRAKSVYYKNRRSKSLEDLSVEDRMNYLRDKAACGGESIFDGSSSSLRKSKLIMGRNASALSIASSCSSMLSKMSDISSSYFHDLSDWSPEFSSSESESSEEELLQNFDWDANLSNIVFSGFNSSNEEESDFEECNTKLKSEFNSKNNDLNRFKTNSDASQLKKDKVLEKEEENVDVLNEITNKADVTANTKIINKMLNEVYSRMIKMHPTLFNEIFPSTPASFEFINSLKSFQITENELKEQSKNNNCAICLGKLELDEEASKLKCEHIFHITCIQFWLSKSATCPACMKISQKKTNCTNETHLFIKRETLL